MNSPGETAPAAPPFRLETLGSLVLRRPEGPAAVVDHGQQGWRLALLAVLAASGEQGCSRDRLLLLFWPDAPQQRARHSLEQLLYKMRKSMGDSLFAGVNPLRLNTKVMTSDVEDFERALGAGDPEAAVGYYRGPFLDGFYLADLPEFELWTIGERARLESEYTTALERLAEAAEEAAEHEAAVRWRRELYSVDPLSSRQALGLMRALADSGDHTTALRHAEQYERLVQQELGTSAGPEIAALAAEIRARAGVEPPLTRRPTPGASATERPRARSVRREDVEILPRAATSVLQRASRGFWIPVAAAAILALVLFGLFRIRNAPPEDLGPAASEPSIAVLPLTNLSGDPGDTGLADGMTEELIGMLSKTGHLRVIASTSVFALAGRRMDVRQIADSLRVSHVLEGGLQKLGSRLHMQVRLVDARDGSTRWSETYDREFEDVFAVQEEIARAVTGELNVRLTGSDRQNATHQPRTTNVAAYEWYLRGMDIALLRTDTGIQQGIEFFDRAIAADSTFAAAYAGKARMHIAEGARGVGAPDRFAAAERAARRALELDDSLGQAHQALGWARLARLDFSSAEAEFERALALDPQVRLTHEGLAHVYLWTGQPARQLEEARLALKNDPFSHTAIRELARALFANGRCDEALELIRPLKELTPPSSVAGIIGGQCYAVKGMWPEAIAEFRWSEENSAAAARSFLGYALARSGRRDEATAILSDLEAGRESSHGAFGIAVVYTGLRDYDRAFGWLDKAIDDNTVTRDLMLPTFEDLHRDPRFERVKSRLGLQ